MFPKNAQNKITECSLNAFAFLFKSELVMCGGVFLPKSMCLGVCACTFKQVLSDIKHR